MIRKPHFPLAPVDGEPGGWTLESQIDAEPAHELSPTALSRQPGHPFSDGQ
ncbi:MAG: hypothetical protein MUF52_12320 [Syntrophobacteraceae bacterium]|jgi:hypothetical protein|nr:hypothetical protein [Syntrophobacteraceae bacterium]